MFRHKPNIHRPKHLCGDGKSYHTSGLQKLRTQVALEESDGDLIGHLMQSERTNELITYGREWLQQFPDHQYAPILVGIWLKTYGSDESVDLAAQYLPKVNTRSIGTILNGVANISPHPRVLVELIEARLEEDPTGEIWGSLQSSEFASGEMDRLILRWLELMRSDPAHGTRISFVALFTKSAQVIDSILMWLDATGGKGIDTRSVLLHLLMGSSQAHEENRDVFVSRTRVWLKEKSYREICRYTLRTADQNAS